MSDGARIRWDKNDDIIVEDIETNAPLLGVTFSNHWARLAKDGKLKILEVMIKELPEYRPEINHLIRNTECIQALNEIAIEGIKPRMPKGMGFMFLMFDYGDKGNMFYISSADRGDMIKAMKEFINKQVQ